MNGSLPNVTEGTYWVSAVRGISYKSLHGEYQINFRKNEKSYLKHHFRGVFVIYKCPLFNAKNLTNSEK